MDRDQMISSEPSTSVPAATAPPAALWRSLLGGAVGAVACLALVLTLGVVAMAPLGMQAALVGVPAAFACVIVSAALYALFSRSSMAAGGPSSSTVLILSLMVSEMLRVEQAGGGHLAATLLVAALSLTVMLMGLLQLLLAGLRLGRLARFVPQAVLAGFTNGIAVLVALAQLPALLAIAPGLWRTQGWQSLHGAHGGALILGLGTAALVWLLGRAAPRLPAAMVGMVLGLLGFHAIRASWPALELGPTLGAVDVSHAWPSLLALWTNSTDTLAGLSRHAPLIGITALLLALVGSMESLLNQRSADQQSGERSDEGLELRALGLANLGGGLLGALPMTLARGRALAINLGGGKGRSGALGAALCSALVIGLAGGAMVWLPRVVLAGVMLTVAVHMVDRRSIRQLAQYLKPGGRHRLGQENLVIMGLVCVVTVWQGPGAGVTLGLLLSMLVFVRGMNRSLLRARFTAQERPSRRIYPAAMERVLHGARPRILGLELEGALFFGSADRVIDEAETRPAGTCCLILDLHRVLSIDESGAMVLRQLELRLARQSCQLRLAGVGPDSAQHRQLLAFWPGATAEALTRWHLDMDHAVEAAELQLLQDEGGMQDGPLGSAVPLVQCHLLQGLSPAQQALLIPLLQRQQLRAGERLFSEGDPGTGLYVLTRGSISIVSAGGQRFASFSPGTLLGELAMLDGRGRSAHAVADLDAEVFLLSRDAVASLSLTDPLLCSQLYRQMALNLAERLRVASSAWRSAAG